MGQISSYNFRVDRDRNDHAEVGILPSGSKAWDNAFSKNPWLVEFFCLFHVPYTVYNMPCTLYSVPSTIHHIMILIMFLRSFRAVTEDPYSKPLSCCRPDLGLAVIPVSDAPYRSSVRQAATWEFSTIESYFLGVLV